ncbi:MAG: homoserine O-acetyltransferase [Saprospiraceae bacterium]
MQFFTSDIPFETESGELIHQLDIAYWTSGTLNEDRSNVIWICHALTANADASDWWAGLFGPGKAIDPSRYFIVCANMIGSCYGSSSPYSINPAIESPYALDFPLITVKDLVKGHRLLADHIGVERIGLLLGGSLGGQQTLEWAVQEPLRFDNIIPMACNAKHSPWGIAFNEAQRMAMMADPDFYVNGEAIKGLEAARAIAIISYRNAQTFNRTQEDIPEKIQDFKSISYLQYQGSKLSNRFRAWSYWSLSRTMDTHDVGRGRGEATAALATIQAKTFIVGISSDLLFPIEEQRFLAENIKGAELCLLESSYGHDGFLIEYSFLNQLLRRVLENE